MSDAEKILLGLAITTLVGALIWLLQSNFNEVKITLKDIQSRMVDKEVCLEKHKAIDEKLNGNSRNIRAIFQRMNGEIIYQSREGDKDD
jgi:phosphomevalonate kinase